MPRRANGEGIRRPRGTGTGAGPSTSPSSPAVLLSSPGRSSATPLASQRTNLYGMPGVSVSTSSLSRPDASLAPHLASSETHLGRMTLTAPDNMLRRQAQERERERKARKAANAARRGGIRVAGGAAAGPSEPRPASAASSRSISPRRRQQRRASRDEQQSSRDDDLVRAPQASSSSRPRMARSNSGPAVLPQEVSRPAAPLVETQSVPTQLAPRASLRRHNIYHEIAHLGLPGVESSSDYSDEEDGGRGASSTSSPPPPPFPQDSRRPETPPRAPPPPREPGHDVQEGEAAWTEEDQQRWIEYRRRVPDSPPPAFVSEGEEDEVVVEVQAGAEQARPSSPSAASESSQDEDVVSDEERRAWDLDAQRGLTFEERIHRLELRRRRKEGMAEQRWREERANEVAVREMLEQEAREAQAQAQAQAQTSAERGRSEEVRAELSAATSTAAAPAAVTANLPPSAAAPSEHLPAIRSETPETAPRAPAPPQPASRIVTDGALSVPSLQVTRSRTHARSTSDQRNTATSSRSKATAIRPRPSSESHSRFRDDASAAAERRRLAWGCAAPLAGLQVPTAPAPRSRDEMEAHRASMTRATSEGAVTSLQDWQAQGRARAGDDEDSASTASSDSADAWEAESKAFDAMRAAAEQTAAVADESDDDESVLSPAPQMIRSPGQIMRESLPKAPPPLALGRSRGAGVAYDASDSESSRDGDDIDDDSDDSLSPDEAEVQRHVNEKWQAQDPTPAATASRRSLDSSAASPAQASSSKGKQPERPNGQAFQQSRSAASDPNLPGAYAQPAGHFEPDSSSSASFSDDDAQEVAGGLEPQKKRATATAMGAQLQPSRSSSSSLWRGRMPGEPPASKRIEVNDRLKGLFDAPLAGSSTQQGPARRSSQRSLRSVEESARIDGGHSSSDRSSTSRQEMQPPPPPPRKVSTSSGLPDEQQLRREALLDIARLQTGSQADRNSLAALERLLAGSLRGEQGEQAAAAPLPFTNRQSSYAPLPRQSRLPQITDATRHFPPSRAPTVSDNSTSGAARVRPPVPGSRISALRARFEGGQEGGSTTNDDGNDPTEGQQGLPRRASPATISRSGAVRRAPPPVPPRVRATSATSAMAPATTASPSTATVSAARRPPPPPPTSAPLPMVAAPGLPPRPAVPLTMPGPPPASTSDGFRHVSSAEDQVRATPPPIVVVPPHTGRRPLPTPPTLLPREESSAGPIASATAPSPDEPLEAAENGARPAAATQSTTQDSSPDSPRSPPRRQPSLGITDLDVLASRLDLEGSHFDELAALQEFLGPAESSAHGVLSPHEMASLPCGPVYIESRRVTREGKTKSKLACLGLRVERCTVCMSQFKEGQMAVVLGCLHVFHEEPCAKTWFRTRSRACPTCRIEAVERVAAP